MTPVRTRIMLLTLALTAGGALGAAPRASAPLHTPATIHESPESRAISESGTVSVESDDGAAAAHPTAADSAVSVVIDSLVEAGSVPLPGGGSLEVDSRYATFVANSPVGVVWTDDSGLSEEGAQWLQELSLLRLEGLEPMRVAWELELGTVLAKLQEAGSIRDRAVAEVVLSTAFLRGTTDLLQGMVDPNRHGLPWHIRRDPPTDHDVLESVARGRSPGAVLDSLRPDLPHYGQLTDALTRYRKSEMRRDGSKIASDEVVERGDTAAVVGQVRERLRNGADPRERALASGSIGDPDFFDDSLAAAVAHFQHRHDLTVDSVVGPATIGALDVPARERAREIRLNLDRIRWMPRELGERAIIVNVAGFKLVLLEESDPVMEMDVVVGEAAWKTALFGDSLTHIVFNPYWHVPESIEEEETLPKALEDPSYLERTNLEIVPPDRPFGEPIDASTIDWNSVDIGSFPYDFRQAPGPENSLGLMKFMFPNRFAIYLHDTPAQHLFDKRFRAFSHGCIRVERPHELARYLVRTSAEIHPSEIESILESRERTRVDLTRPTRVYVSYFTTWPTDDGESVRFHEDIYDRDDNVQPLLTTKGARP